MNEHVHVTYDEHEHVTHARWQEQGLEVRWVIVHISESCHIWINTYTSNIQDDKSMDLRCDESWHILVSHITYEWTWTCHLYTTTKRRTWGAMSHGTYQFHVTYEWTCTCHIWMNMSMSHIQDDKIMDLRRDESWHILVSHVTYEWTCTCHMSHVTHVNESCHTESCHTCEWVMSHFWMSHVTHTVWPKQGHEVEWVKAHLNESCHTREWVMSHMWMSHVTHLNESCHTYSLTKSRTMRWNESKHIWMSHVTHVNKSCHTFEWVMSHIWMSHVTLLNESCHTFEWVMSHIQFDKNKDNEMEWVKAHLNESCHTCE